MLKTKLNNVHSNATNKSNLTSRAKNTGKDLLDFATFLSHMIAGYVLHDNTNKILAITGVFLLSLGLIRLLSISFRETENLNK